MAEAAVAGRREADSWLLTVTLLLSGIGLVMVLSASQALAVTQHLWGLHYGFRQGVGVALGLGGLLVLRRIDYHRLRRLAPPAAVAVAVLMVLVAVPHVGVLANGARRWFNLGPLGSFQPSELGKLVFAVYIAHWVDLRQTPHSDRLQDLYDGFVPFALMLAAVIGVLYLLEKDLGTALITGSIFSAAYFAGGGRKRHLVLLVLGLGALFFAVLVLDPLRAARFTSFTSPFRDSLDTTFQSTQGLIALGSGGLTGVGLGHSVQKYLWLPAAHTDFIFAIIGEETGLVGTTAVLGGFVFFSLRGYRAAMRAPDRFGVMVACAITTWISFQALINMAAVTDTLPITGVPLPFVSYGGTSVAVSLAAVGVLLNISSQGERQSYRRTNAAVDIGRRDRGTPLPSPRRRASLPR